jgi:hypothetical protein
VKKYDQTAQNPREPTTARFADSKPQFVAIALQVCNALDEQQTLQIKGDKLSDFLDDITSAAQNALHTAQKQNESIAGNFRK